MTPAPPTAAAKSAPPKALSAAAAPLLQAAPGGDGDSWKDTRGREYRLGLVNTPEANECYGDIATAKRRALVANGFRARVYTTDTYGRSVSVVTLPDGRNLNVYLARHGFANDQFLAQFRAENPSLAARLDTAFAAAKREGAGLWRACKSTPSRVAATRAPAPPPRTGSSCHPEYVTCIPIKGDGSGSGEANDLDCPDIAKRVTLRGSSDPYRLDADDNGLGCESYG